jgi:hypothetical protein
MRARTIFSPAPQADFTKDSHSALGLHRLQGAVGLDIVPHVFLVAKHPRTLILPFIHELSKASNKGSEK